MISTLSDCSTVILSAAISSGQDLSFPNPARWSYNNLSTVVFILSSMILLSILPGVENS